MARSIRPGRLRHLVSLQRASASRDAAGQETRTWTTYKTWWAAIEPLSANELLLARQVEGRVSHRIQMRYRPDLQPTDRIVLGTRVFQIAPAMHTDEVGYETVVMAEEVAT
jgi:SPP1 family predicted phage head-tail adaptor